MQGIGVFLLGLGQLALGRGQHDEAAAMFHEAQQRFINIGLPNWADQAEQLLQQAQREQRRLTLDDILAMVQAARNGNQQAGQQAWDISQGLKDSGQVALGRALERLLAGLPLESAVAGLPDDLQVAIVAGLEPGS